MFTGIVDHFGAVEKVSPSPTARHFLIHSTFADLVLGESIAVNGVCLTVTKVKNSQFGCDVSPETLALTTLGAIVEQSKVNLERALRLSDRLGGHWVTGHVDNRVRLSERESISEFVRFRFAGVPENLQRYLVKKGSICLNGVSLTINEVLGDTFEVMLIPHTLERTNLQDLKVGDFVNVEFDWMMKVLLNDRDNRLQWMENLKK